MQFKKGAKAHIGTENFWYALFTGGYIKPNELLKNKADIEKVEEAVKVLKEFRQSAEDQEVVEEM